MTEIFFLSYNESNAEKNWHALRERFPHAQRVHGIKGVKLAHQRVAELARGEFFFIVDGDNRVHADFNFTYSFTPQKDTLYVWRCLNPVNELVYGYGGIKLYNKHLLLELQRPTAVDVATSIAVKYEPVFITASTTHFNETPFEAWRGAFREALKLTLNLAKKPNDKASAERLQVWCTAGGWRPHGEWCLLGAKQGREYGETHRENPENLSLINDFDWLKSHFDFLHSQSTEALPSMSL